MKLETQIIDRLKKLFAPEVQTERERQAYFYSALGSIPLLDVIEWGGGSDTFVANMLRQIESRAEWQALSKLLKYLLTRVGYDKKQEIQQILSWLESAASISLEQIVFIDTGTFSSVNPDNLTDRIIFLDAGPLRMVMSPRNIDEKRAALTWLKNLLNKRVTVMIPEIVGYRLRRLLVKRGKISNFNQLEQKLFSFSLDTETFIQAAHYWSLVEQGLEELNSLAIGTLDGDVILCAQIARANSTRGVVVVATDNQVCLEALRVR